MTNNENRKHSLEKNYDNKETQVKLDKRKRTSITQRRNQERNNRKRQTNRNWAEKNKLKAIAQRKAKK